MKKEYTKPSLKVVSFESNSAITADNTSAIIIDKSKYQLTYSTIVYY